MSKTFLFQAIQFSQIALIQTIQFSVSTVSISKIVLFQTIQFSISMQCSSIWLIDRTLIMCYHCGPQWTWERWQWRVAPHSPKLQHYWNLTIRFFCVISGTFVGVRGLAPLQRCSRVLYSPQPTGQPIRERNFSAITDENCRPRCQDFFSWLTDFNGMSNSSRVILYLEVRELCYLYVCVVGFKIFCIFYVLSISISYTKNCTQSYYFMYKHLILLIHHHHHHVVLVARISLTLSRHFSLSFIASGRSSGQHPVSSHSCWIYVRAGRPAFARPCGGGP